MAKTINDAHLDLAYRVGETAVPTSATELAKRLSWFKLAINIVCGGERPFWFMQEYVTDATEADVQDYDLPSDFRFETQIKVDDYKYDKAPFDEIHDRYELASSPVPIIEASLERAFYIWDNKIYFIPIPSAAPTSHTVTITSSAAVCTVTDTAHGYTSDNYVTIAGANETAYNGKFQITVTGDDSYTYTAASTPSATPATGTITAVKDNIQFWYYKKATEPTSTSSSIVVPDDYIDLLVSFAEARYWSFAHKRGKAADAFAEFETRLANLRTENERHRFGEK